MTDMVDMFFILDGHLLIAHTRVFIVCSTLEGIEKKIALV